MTDFDHATDVDRARAKTLAEAAGWRQRGFLYSHPTRGNYLTKDMDGWIDLCDNEGIIWDEPLFFWCQHNRKWVEILCGGMCGCARSIRI